MARDFPVEGRLFIIGIVVILLTPLFAAALAAAVDPGAPNQELDWYALFTLGAAVLLILSAIYGRTGEERAQAGPSASQ